jgi:hypothetical protein
MVLNFDYIKGFITNDGEIPVPFRWSHGATNLDMGDGLLIYTLIQFTRSKNCVCIGSGGGYIPRIMTQARIDLHKSGIFEGNPDYNWGEIGATYVVDPCNGIGGQSNMEDESGFYRSNFYPRFIKETSEKAYYNFFVMQDIKIDFLFIDGDHSYEGVSLDFDLYKNVMSKEGIIAIHDTDGNFSKNYIVTEDQKKDFHEFNGPSQFVSDFVNSGDWEIFNLFNYGRLKDKPASSGITLFKKKVND